jgi:hypothetical protein
MDICVHLFCICVALCVRSGLATGWSPVQGVLPTLYRLRNSKSGQGPQLKRSQTGMKQRTERQNTYPFMLFNYAYSAVWVVECRMALQNNHKWWRN